MGKTLSVVETSLSSVYDNRAVGIERPVDRFIAFLGQGALYPFALALILTDLCRSCILTTLSSME